MAAADGGTGTGADATGDGGESAAPDPGTVRVRVGAETLALTRDQARDLREGLSAALTSRRTFVHTVGHRRADGTYAVERRNADSAGHRKVFDSFEACRALFAALPREFTAEDVAAAGAGVSGGRRHMLVRHFAEHPAFDCELASRQPLTGRKRPADGPVPGTATESGPRTDPEREADAD